MSIHNCMVERKKTIDWEGKNKVYSDGSESTNEQIIKRRINRAKEKQK